MSQPHEPTDACDGDHCHSCGVDEPIPAGARPYIVCFECGHVYWKPRDLVRSYRRKLRQEWRHEPIRPRVLGSPFALSWWTWLRLYLGTRADRITFCQECIHDF